MYCRPSLLVADDPLAAVDSLVCNKVFANLQALVQEKKTSVVIAMNQLHLLHKCDYIVFLVEGRIKAQGVYADLIKDCEEFVALVHGGDNGASTNQPDKTNPAGPSEVEAEAEAEERAMASVAITTTSSEPDAGTAVTAVEEKLPPKSSGSNALVKAETRKLGDVSRYRTAPPPFASA
jgi:ABC-type multidrug transport system ATPase subunit